MENENKLMRQKIAELLRLCNPENRPRIACEGGVLEFDRECDEVKMEKLSLIEKKEEKE